jgi:hypothetical protein
VGNCHICQISWLIECKLKEILTYDIGQWTNQPAIFLETEKTDGNKNIGKFKPSIAYSQQSDDVASETCESGNQNLSFFTTTYPLCRTQNCKKQAQVYDCWDLVSSLFWTELFWFQFPPKPIDIRIPFWITLVVVLMSIPIAAMYIESKHSSHGFFASTPEDQNQQAYSQ